MDMQATKKKLGLKEKYAHMTRGLDERSEVVGTDVERLEVGQLVDSVAHDHQAELPGGGTEGG